MRSFSSRRIMVAWVLATSLFALYGATSSAQATVYKWVDSSGIAHYTTDPAEVPASLRSQIPSAQAGESTDLERIPPPSGQAGKDLLSAIPAPRPGRSDAPASIAIPEARHRETGSDSESTIESQGIPLQSIPPPRHLAVSTVQIGAIPPPHPRRNGPRAIVEPAPLGPEVPAPKTSGEDFQTPSPGSEASHSVDSGPPFDPLFDDPITRESSEILELQRRIQADRDALKKMLTSERSSDAPLSDDPELRAISERLPALQARLAALRAPREP